MSIRRNQPKPEDFEHTPLLAMWYQIRHALADLAIPLLAGFKTVWLLLFSPINFFKAICHNIRPLHEFRTPFDPLWRSFTHEERRPLAPSGFLLFGIFAATLTNFEFDNSNRLLGLVGGSESDVTNSALTTIAERSPRLGTVIINFQQFWNEQLGDRLTEFFDASIFSAVLELIANLIILVVFSYIFYLLNRRKISATHSYSFWLYMAGLQFFTTAVSRLFFTFFSLPTFGFSAITPDIIFVVMETGLFLLWQFIYPAYVLHKVFPSTIEPRQVLVTAVIGRLTLALIGWLLFGGFVIILSFFS